MDLKDVVGWGAWAGLIWLRMMVGSCECGNEPLEIIKVWEFLTRYGPFSFSRRILLHGIH